MTAYYNEFDPGAAAWLRELIAGGHIAPGDVDERDIRDIRPDDLRRYTQCHFFAGIGGWSLALRMAGWADDRPVWTGSCPCQPFSAAGKRAGTSDERHLWPDFFKLIEECKPDVVFGEQVASADGLAWLSGENQTLQTLRDREALLRVLCQLKGEPPLVLQGLRAGDGARAEKIRPGQNSGKLQGLARQEAGARSGQCCASPSEGEGLGVLVGPEGCADHDRCRVLPVDEDSFLFGPTAGLERAVTGPGGQLEGLHAGEHAGSTVRSECDGEHLGCEPDRGNCDGTCGEPACAERAVAGLFDLGVETPDAAGWVRSVCSDMEGAGYAIGAADMCVAGIGGPHIRQRLWFGAERLADAGGERIRRGFGEGTGASSTAQRAAREWQWGGPDIGRGFADGGLADTAGAGSLPGALGRVCGGQEGARPRDAEPQRHGGAVEWPGPLHGFWRDADWLLCRDGKWRPVEPGTFPLAHGIPGRVGLLRGYGNAISPPVAAEFIQAWEEARAERVRLSAVSTLESIFD